MMTMASNYSESPTVNRLMDQCVFYPMGIFLFLYTVSIVFLSDKRRYNIMFFKRLIFNLCSSGVTGIVYSVLNCGVLFTAMLTAHEGGNGKFPLSKMRNPK